LIDGLEISPEHALTINRLAAIEDGLKGSVVRRGLDVAAAPLVAAMENNAPVDRGDLSKSIGKSKLSKTAAARIGFEDLKPGEQVILVGPNRKVKGRHRGRIANLVEEGTDPHEISSEGLLSISKRVFVKKVKHPGIKATHFMKRSLMESEAGIEDRFFAGMEEKLNKLMLK
jgi:hypothetical protein